ncbi:MAG: NAD-dependent epimerase/dehydratase family protein [Bacteroidia bacterium]
MKVAITGSSGHLGRVVADELLLRNYSVNALMYQDKSFSNRDVEIVNGDLNNISSLKNLVKDCETVIHCAGKISINSNRDKSVYETNVGGTKNILEAAIQNGVRKFIHISSIHAYNQFPKFDLLNEERNYCSNNAPLYDQSKRDAQKLVLNHTGKGIEIVVLNPTAIIGAPDYKPSLTGKAIIDIYNKKIPALLNGGFDFCDVRDVANGIVNAIEHGRNGESYLLSAKWRHIEDVAKIVMKIKGEKNYLPVLPAWMGYAGLPFANLYSSIKKSAPLFTTESIDALTKGNRNISRAKATKDLNYHCRPLEETIADLIMWFKQQHFIE